MKRVTPRAINFVEPRDAPSCSRPETASFLNRKFFDFERELSYPRSSRQSDWTRWRKKLQASLRQTMCLDKLGKVPTPAWATLEQVETREYTRLKIAYETLSGNWVTAYLLLPHQCGRCPAVICPHGHVEGGKDSVVFPERALGQAYGHELACRGAVVLAPDNAGMGERVHLQKHLAPGTDGCRLVWSRLNHMGLDLTGFRVFELMAGVNLLQKLPQVDPRRIGAAGLSGGCWLAQVLTALDSRIRAVVLSGFFTTFVQTVWHGHCICHHPFGIGKLCDIPDISALIAPRPQFIESGKQDRFIPFQPGFRLLQEAYDLCDAAGYLAYHRYRGGHLFKGEKSIPWLVARLAEA